jgi:hypothetical protein
MIKKIFIALYMIIFLSNIVSAQINGINVNINVKDVFYTGEMVKFDYTIISSDYEGIISYTPSVFCNKSYQISPMILNISLTSGKSYSSNFTYGLVDDLLSSEICQASVFIETGKNNEIFQKSFEIIADEDLIIDVFFCKDESCMEKSKTFILGEKIYINYNSNVDSIVDGLLKKPSNNQDNIMLPYNFVPSVAGSYSLKVTSSKQGYKNYERDYEFGVIESSPIISKEDDSPNIKKVNTTNKNITQNQNIPNETIYKENISTPKSVSINKDQQNNLIKITIIIIILGLISWIIFIIIPYYKEFFVSGKKKENKNK